MQPDLLAKKIRIILLEQKSKLTKYLDVLEKEKISLSDKNPDQLSERIEIESSIIEELNAFKKVLEPLEIMYGKSPYKKDVNLKNLKNVIYDLCDKVTTKTDKNKKQLNNILNEIKLNINQIKNNSKINLNNSYNNVESRLVDISG